RIRVIKDVVFRLAEQDEKKRLGDGPQPESWRCYFLSTSNYSLAEMAKRGRTELDNADLGRLFDIPLPRSDFGIYEDLHGFSDGQQFTDALKNRCRLHFGSTIRVFIG